MSVFEKAKFLVIAKKKKRKDRFKWQEKDIKLVPTNKREKRFSWDLTNIKIVKLGKHTVKSWKTDYFKEIKDSSKPKTVKNHLKPWHQEVLNDVDKTQKPLIDDAKARAKTRELIPYHHAVVKTYVEDSTNLNSCLRLGKTGNTVLKKHVKALDHVTNHALPHNTVVYRGLSKDFRDLPAGTVFKDKAYTSTSLSLKTARFFGDSKYPTVARIFHKAGDKGAYLNECKGKYDPNNDEHSSEEEVLLPRNQKYKILGHSFNHKTNTHYVDMEIHHPKKRVS